MRATAILVVCLLPLVWAQSVQARPKNKPEDPEIVARKACAEGDFRTGVSILAVAVWAGTSSRAPNTGSRIPTPTGQSMQGEPSTVPEIPPSVPR